MWDDYKRIRKLGQGGMGEVWLVVHNESRLPYAAKLINASLARPKDEARFQREIGALRALRHPNIVRVFDATSEGERPLGYVMEYCPDGDVGQRREFDTQQVVTTLTAAVVYLHARGFIHRDIKPANILFALDGTLRLADFGLVVTDDPGRGIVTTSNWVSEGFAPPEQYVDMSSVDHRADIYSIGAVWYYLLTKQLYRHGDQTGAQLASVHDRERAIIGRCLAYDRRERYQSATDLANELVVLRTFNPDRVDIPPPPEYVAAEREARRALLKDEFAPWLRVDEANPDPWDDAEYQRALDRIRAIMRYESDSILHDLLVSMYVRLYPIDRWYEEEHDPHHDGLP